MEENDEMDDNTDSGNFDSSSSILYGAAPTSTAQVVDNDLGDHLGYPYTFGCQTRQPDSDTFGMQANRFINTTRNNEETNNVIKTDKDCSPQCAGTVESYCHVKLDSLIKMKDSTKKLLCLLEDIQAKTCSKSDIIPKDVYQLSELIKPIAASSTIPSVTDLKGVKAIEKLETQTKTLDIIEDDDDDCSIYKRLTRKCHCLNQLEYNDFIIHFNESTKYLTSTMGEIIKNMRILKRFLYMGGDYSRHALMFLNEGLSYSTHMEKIDIAQGCAHADVCNVFDEQSIVVVCIAWPCNENCRDFTSQALAASFLNKLAQIEEGRRYLKFSSKITNDLKKIIRKKAAQLDFDTLESLNSTLNIMHPPLTQNTNVTYYCKPVDEGFGSTTMATLLQYRQYMTLEEVFTHLDLLHNFSNSDSGKCELIHFLPTLLNLFKHMLMEYDNSEINIIITNILNNIVSRSMVKPRESPNTVVMAETGTEPIKMKDQINQIPYKKSSTKKGIKSKIRLSTSPSRRPLSKAKGLGWDHSVNKSKKFSREPNYSVIIVPLED